MKAKEAAAQSRSHVATRYDNRTGLVWIYNKDKNGLLILTRLKDRDGDYMWELHENPLNLEEHDDWRPYPYCGRIRVLNHHLPR